MQKTFTRIISLLWATGIVFHTKVVALYYLKAAPINIFTDSVRVEIQEPPAPNIKLPRYLFNG